MPSIPQPLRNAVVIGAFGFAAGAAPWWAGVVDQQDRDPTAGLPAPLVAEIFDFELWSPEAGDRSLFDADGAEAYQFLLTSFEYAQAQSGARSILITRRPAGEGKSLTALQIARALAVAGRSILLVDSDLVARASPDSSMPRTASVSSTFRRRRRPRRGGTALPDLVRHRPTGHPTGRPLRNRWGLLATDRYREALARPKRATS